MTICAMAALSVTLAACGGESELAPNTAARAVDVAAPREAPAPAKPDRVEPRRPSSVRGRPPAERRQSHLEGRIGQLAWWLQTAVANGEYAIACTLLTASARAAMAGIGRGCAAGLAAVVNESKVRQPQIAWVRIRRATSGNVVIRRPPNGALALAPVSHERGRWGFADLEIAGIETQW